MSMCTEVVYLSTRSLLQGCRVDHPLLLYKIIHLLCFLTTSVYLDSIKEMISYRLSYIIYVFTSYTRLNLSDIIYLL